MDRFQILSTALQVANDLVAFDSHSVYLLPVLSYQEVVWHYELGVRQDSQEFRAERLKVIRATRRFARLWEKVQCDEESVRLDTVSIPLRYDGLELGFAIHKREDGKSIPANDVTLLHSIWALAAATIVDRQAAGLLQRLHLYSLHRRTAISEFDSPDDVLADYLEKCRDVCHPGLNALASRDFRVRTTAKVINANRMSLYIRAFHSTYPSDAVILRSKSVRYDAWDRRSFASRTFQMGKPVLTNDYARDCDRAFRIFKDSASHMSAPILVASGPCYGVLSIETTDGWNYNNLDLHAFTLIAAHAARPLGRAVEREQANIRVKEIVAAREAFLAIQRCKTWDEIVTELQVHLSALRYRRGLICAVDYDRRRVVGYSHWGPKMRELQRSTRRYFSRNKNDVQVRCVLSRESVRIDNPKTNRAAHREALKIAKLVPFAVVPLADAGGVVRWTLHLERDDTAPMADRELADLEGLCRCVMAAKELLDLSAAQNRQIELDSVAVEWANVLNSELFSERAVLEKLAGFVVQQRIGTRCLVFHADRMSWIGVCFAGRRLPIKRFSGFRLHMPRDSTKRLLKKAARPILVRWARTEARVPISAAQSDDFITAQQAGFPQAQVLGLRNVSEWVEIPLYQNGIFYGMVLVTRNSHNRRPGNVPERRFSPAELRLLREVGRTTSLALDRVRLEKQLLHEAMLAACMATLRHEVKSKYVEIKDAATSLKEAADAAAVAPQTRRLLDNIDAELQQVGRLSTFFQQRIFGEDPSCPEFTTVASEIVLAKSLLRLDPQLISWPDRSSRMKVPAKQHPLCLVLLQLFTNAVKAVTHCDLARIFVRTKRLSANTCDIFVVDNGTGISAERWAEICGNGVVSSGDGSGLGLRYAHMICRALGWTLRLSSSRHKGTRWCLRVHPHTHSSILE